MSPRHSHRATARDTDAAGCETLVMGDVAGNVGDGALRPGDEGGWSAVYQTSLRPDVRNVGQYISADFVMRTCQSLKLHLLRRRRLVASLTVFLIAGIAANVLFKLELNAMYNYPLYTSQLNPIILAIFFGVGLNIEIRYDNSIPWKEVLAFPMWKLVIVSLFDVTANVMELKSSDAMGKDAGPLSMLLAQCVIPFTMLFSFLLLRRRYGVFQIAGAVVILGGVLIVIVPPGVHASKSVLYTGLYAVSRMPTSLNKVIKEYIFLRHSLTVLFVGFWEQVFNVVTGALAMLFCWPVIQGVPLRDVPGVLLRGTWCAVGRNSLPTDDCAHAPWLIILFTVSAVIWMGSTLAVVKHGSATVAFLASAILIPLCDFFFASHAIFGKDAKTFHWYDFVGLIVILAGMVGYAIGSVQQEKKTGSADIQATNDSETGGDEEADLETDELDENSDRRPLVHSSAT